MKKFLVVYTYFHMIKERNIIANIEWESIKDIRNINEIRKIEEYLVTKLSGVIGNVTIVNIIEIDSDN